MRDNTCVLFSSADWDAQYLTNKQHTAKALSAKGYRVLYVERIGLRAPKINQLDLSRLLLRLFNSLKPIKAVEENIWVLSPFAIPFKQHWPIVKYINQGLLAYRVKRFLKRVGAPKPLIWTYHPFVNQITQRIPHSDLVYHCVDDLSQIPGIDAKAFNIAEKKLLGLADVVFVTSQQLFDKCSPHHANTHYLSNVVDITHFQQAFLPSKPPLEIAEIPLPRLVYHGVLSDFKLDFRLLLKVASLQKDWQFVLIGEEREGQYDPQVSELRKLPNVHFLGMDLSKLDRPENDCLFLPTDEPHGQIEAVVTR